MFLLFARAARRLAESLSAWTAKRQMIHAFGQFESQRTRDRIRFCKTELKSLAQCVAIAGTLPFQRMFGLGTIAMATSDESTPLAIIACIPASRARCA